MTDVETMPPTRQPGEAQRLANASRARDAIGEALEKSAVAERAVADALVTAHDAIAGLEVLVTQLQTALNTRIVIAQATGVRMAHGLTADEAFAELVGISQHTNRKIGAIAAEIVRDAQAASRGDNRVGTQQRGVGGREPHCAAVPLGNLRSHTTL